MTVSICCAAKGNFPRFEAAQKVRASRGNYETHCRKRLPVFFHFEPDNKRNKVQTFEAWKLQANIVFSVPLRPIFRPIEPRKCKPIKVSPRLNRVPRSKFGMFSSKCGIIGLIFGVWGRMQIEGEISIFLGDECRLANLNFFREFRTK